MKDFALLDIGMFFKQKGIVGPHLLIVLAFLGVTVYLMTSSLAPFKDQFFSKLYPKSESKAFEGEGDPYACGRSNQTEIGTERIGYTCNLDSNGCIKTPYAHYIYATDQNGDGTIDADGNGEIDPYDQPWCNNICADPIKSCPSGGEAPPPSGNACSGNACYDCILNARPDVLENFGDWGWGTSCGIEQTAIAIEWCTNLDYNACQTLKTTTCAQWCGYATPTPTSPPTSSCPYSGDNCVYSAGDGKCYSGKTSNLSTCTPGYEGCFNPSAGCTYSCGPLTSCPKYIGDGGVTDPTNWIACAWEGQRCNFGGTKLVRYGANGVYVYKTFTDGVDCTNGVFGDPLVGVVKQCHYAETTIASTSTPTPVPVTNSFNLESNCNSGPGLSASWVAGTGDKCNAHIYAGSTAYKISSNCTGTWTGNILGSTSIVNGGTYKLCVNNASGKQMGCSNPTIPNCSTGGITSCTNPTGAEGDWNYVCTTNTCPTDSTKGVGYPYRCENGQWINKNTSGECTNQCKPAGATPTPTPTPGGSCPTQTCSYTTSVSTSLCPSGLYLCTGSGTTGTNQPNCTYTQGCSSCQCYTDPDIPPPNSSPTPTPIPVSGNTQNCNGRYNFNKKDPYIMCPKVENFADADCSYVNGANYGKDQLYSILRGDQRLVNKTTLYQGQALNDYDIWFNRLIAQESGFNPNIVNSWLLPCGSSSNKGAFGFAQMGGVVPTKSGNVTTYNSSPYDRGDKHWREQINNFLNYQQGLINNAGECKKWNYWQAVSYLWNLNCR